MRFSPSARAFFDPAIHGDAIPADAVEISAAEHRRLLAAQGDGRTIEVRDDGRPVATPRRTPTLAERKAAAIAAVKREAARRIDGVAPLWQQVNDLAELLDPSSTGDAARGRLARIAAIRAASNRLEAAIHGMSSPRLAATEIAADLHWPED